MKKKDQGAVVEVTEGAHPSQYYRAGIGTTTKRKEQGAIDARAIDPGTDAGTERAHPSQSRPCIANTEKKEGREVV